MSSRSAGRSYPAAALADRFAARSDPAEEVALVAQAARARLLAMYRRLLRHEDLEDCYSQATCELIAQARAGRLRYSSRTHLLNTLQLRFGSRVTDRRRALRGRSPTQAALDAALPFGALREGGEELADPRADVERRALLRCELRSLEEAARELTPDQRLVLACQIGLQMDTPEFCRRFGWSPAKHRKVAQRARTRLRLLLGRPAAPAGAAAGAAGDEAAEVVVEAEVEARVDAGTDFSPTGVPFRASRREIWQGPSYDHTSPAHRRVPGDAGSRWNGRPLGDAPPRARGRRRSLSPARLPVARVDSSLRAEGSR